MDNGPYLQWAALCSVVLIIGIPSTAGAQNLSAENYPIDFAPFVELAWQYALPMPPAKAPLVLADSGWTTNLGASSTSHDPAIYRPAFLLEELPRGRARVLFGWQEQVVETRAEHRPATRRFSLLEQRPAPKGYLLGCNDVASFVTAVQLAQRGDLERARDIWQAIARAEHFQDEHPPIAPIDELRATPQVLLGRSAYRYFELETLRERADLKAIYHKLLQLEEEFPVLFSSEPDDDLPHRRTQFIRDLGATLSAARPREGSVDALLIAWANRGGDIGELGYFDPDNVEDRPVREIFLRGAPAIAELEKLIEDRRLTRHTDDRGQLRVGQLARRLLNEMAGTEEVGRAAAIGNSPEAERKFFEQAAVGRTDGVEDRTVLRLNEVPLWFLGQKHPGSLLTICATIPSETSAHANLWPLAEAVGTSNLTLEQRTDALSGMCERLTDIGQQAVILQQLAAVNEDRCVTLLRPILAKLPSDVSEPYSTCAPARYSHVVMQIQQDAIWRDYLAVARRASVGPRMEIMDPMSYLYIKDKNRQRRLAFLAAFLDDATVRDPAVDADKYRGPCAAFTFGRIEVRDFAAMKIGYLLDLGDRPTEFWTPAEWAPLREKVRKALAQEQLPRLVDQGRAPLGFLRPDEPGVAARPWRIGNRCSEQLPPASHHAER